LRTSLAHLIAARPFAVVRSSALWRELHRLALGGEVELDPQAFEARARHAASFRERLGAQIVAGGVQVIPVRNIITQRFTWLTWAMDGTALDWLRGALAEAVADPDVNAIVLDMDSPGGFIDGLPEFAADLREFAKSKPITASVNPTDGSAALWISSQASELAVTPSGTVGSIGVYQMHIDQSRALDADGLAVTLIHAAPYKVEGNPFEPLTDEAEARIQVEIDHWYGLFLADVAKGRNTTVSNVRDNFGGGRMLLPHEATAVGLADRVESFDATVHRLSRPARAAGARRADADGNAPVADDPTSDLAGDAAPTPTPIRQPDPAWVAVQAAVFNRAAHGANH
jgi:signal peptide peptidase SppA